VLPLPSIFHPALALSVLGQLTIHAACMLAAVRMATSIMGEAAVREAVTSARRADRLAEAGDEEAAASAHRCVLPVFRRIIFILPVPRAARSPLPPLTDPRQMVFSRRLARRCQEERPFADTKRREGWGEREEGKGKF
jgi:hypothetical protein